MPIKQQKPFAQGTLSAAILAGATSLTLNAGQGPRFNAPGAGEYFYATLVDYNEATTFARYEVVKVTAVSGDTFTIVRAQDSTSALAFPITSGNPANLVAVIAGDNIAQLRQLSQGQGAIIQAAAPTLAFDSPEMVVLTPTGNINLSLPTTDVWAGRRFRVVNLSAFTITIKASGGATIWTLPGLANITIMALQDAPTLAAHWAIPSTFFPNGVVFGTGGTATHRGAGVLRDAAGVSTVQTTTVTLLGAGGPTSGVLQSATMLANTLSANGKFCIWKAFGTKTGTNATFSLEWRVGGTAVGTPVNFTLTAIMNWYMFLLLVRTGVGAQKYGFYAVPPRDDTGSITLCGTGTLAKDETTDLAVDVFCTTKSTNDVVTGEILAPIFFA